jgi:DNA gyrase subunit B
MSLKGAERVRLKPASMLGSDDIIGCQHTFIEILANAVDEAREGYGDEIIVTRFKDYSIEVEDFGRGVPLGYNEQEKRWNWELVFCELYAGGKYKKTDESAYEYSLGTNGLGATATQYTSEYMCVKSYNGQTLSEMNFKKGDPIYKGSKDNALRVVEITPDMKKKRGTVIKWRPDLEVFKEINIPLDFFQKTLRRQACVNADIKFVLRFEDDNGKFTTEEFYYENGIFDYIHEISEGIELTPPVKWSFEAKGRDREDLPDYKFKADITFCFSKSGMAEYYHNSSFLEHTGSPDQAVKNSFTYAVDKYIKAQNKYLKNETKISFADIQDNLTIIINSASTQTSYENQTKKAVTNKFIKDALNDYIKQHLEIYFTENRSHANTIATTVLNNKRSKEAILDHINEVKKKLGNSATVDVSGKVDKFIPCNTKDTSVREVYIVEGDSAATSCKLGTNADFQAIMPVRGKTLNCMKSSYDKIFASEIIIDLLKVIGCGVEVKGGKKAEELNTFQFGNLRWNKIIICTDADEDGFQIRTLLLTLFYRLLPTLIEKGKIYIAESPLFEITAGSDTYFAYNEQEKVDILSKLGNKKYTIQRSKGLGENTPKMMWQTTMCPQTRRLVAVTPTDAQETARVFDMLLGDAIKERKRYITENGHLYIADADI